MSIILKYASLLFIVVQTTTMVLVLRFSRTQTVEGPRYLSSSAVVTAEFFKILVCVAVLFWENGFSASQVAKQLYCNVWAQKRETFKMLVPAGLYTLQNNLLFFALSLLDAATYQVTYQLKILTTAMFSILILKRRISKQQWLGLVVLVVGVILVQTPSKPGAQKAMDVATVSQFLGLLAVLTSCLSSGFSGIYLEKLLKETTWSLWIRNVQLAIFGFLLGILAMLLADWNALLAEGFFQGYNSVTWTVIFLQTFGGLIVSLAVRYADSILKGFATSVSIVLSTFCSYFLLGDLLPTGRFFMGAGTVIFVLLLNSYGYFPLYFGNSRTFVRKWPSTTAGVGSTHRAAGSSRKTSSSASLVLSFVKLVVGSPLASNNSTVLMPELNQKVVTLVLCLGCIQSILSDTTVALQFGA
uniref:Putative solute carrier family 35 udp-n-acetylglucosamine udp-glcnac transporter n=1 Tax=Ixodes ricinus TaxID=34613 RepID=V5HD05_IXORI